MIGQLQTILDIAGQSLAVAFVVFLRIGAAMALLPALGERQVPVRVKLAIGLSLTAIVAPAVAREVAPLASGLSGILTSMASETISGLIIGIVLRLAVLALEMAGAIAAQSMSLSQLFGAGGEPMPSVSHLLVAGGLALALMLGLHVRLVEFIILSYSVLRPGIFPVAAALKDLGVGQVSWAFALAFSLAAPFVIAALVYNVALGAINRAMPQLMVAFVGAPALTAGALLLLCIAAPIGLSIWADAFGAMLSDPFGAPQ
ncbi:MAG: flagellar biosynthetic protein FliR [Rhodobacteraceae bacterium]|nr:flagellar biosynthetic protein FliR [Paracoccaceae bacterium]